MESIVALYAEDVSYSSEPYRIPFRGQDGARAYVAGAFAEEDESAPGSASHRER